jgi:hypothetical protein
MLTNDLKSNPYSIEFISLMMTILSALCPAIQDVFWGVACLNTGTYILQTGSTLFYGETLRTSPLRQHQLASAG